MAMYVLHTNFFKVQFTTSDLQTTVLKNACGFDFIGQFRFENDEFYSDITGRSGVQNLRESLGPKTIFSNPLSIKRW